MFRPIFHLAFPVRDLEQTKNFYVTTFGARVGRVRDKWIDIFLFEGQITLHERPSEVLSCSTLKLHTIEKESSAVLLSCQPKDFSQPARKRTCKKP